LRGWGDVFRKELKEFVRDRRVLYSAVLGPLVLEVFIILLFGYLSTSFTRDFAHKVIVENSRFAEPFLSEMTESKKFEIVELKPGISIEEALAQKQGRLAISFPENFNELFETGQSPEVRVTYDPNEETALISLAAIKEVYSSFASKYSLERMTALNIDARTLLPFVLVEDKLPVEKPFAGAWLVGFLPYLIVIWAFYGGFSIVGDLVAGEKERGSLETLLITPVTRQAIAFGKFCALGSVSLASCISALAGVLIMGVAPIPMTQKLFESGLSLSPASIFAIAVTIIPLVMFFAGILLAVSTFARNQREVQSYLSLLSFVVLIPAIFSQIIGYTDIAGKAWVNLIPILNSASVMRDALLNRVDWSNLGLTSAVSVILAIGGLWLAVKLFTKEKVLMRV
jgi:sodium transport system permease protein